jgi:hypothetical protein
VALEGLERSRQLLGTLIGPGGLLLPAYLMHAAIEPAGSDKSLTLVLAGRDRPVRHGRLPGPQALASPPRLTEEPA